MRRPLDWPRYMIERRLKSGAIAYYWAARPKDVAAGFAGRTEPLGQTYAGAVTRAETHNARLDAWRAGGTVKQLDLQPTYGTLRWLVERYRRSPAWDKVSARNRPHYAYTLDQVLDLRLSSGDTLGDGHVRAVSARAVDKAYAKLRTGPKKTGRTRAAVLCIQRMARAWDVVGRLYPELIEGRIGPQSPWRGVEMVHGAGTTRPATREEAYALHRALIGIGQPWLAAVPLICWEWHQRPENVLAGHFRWEHFRPAGTPEHVRIVHAKTGVEVAMPLADEAGPLFPELAAYLDALPAIGAAVALYLPERAGREPAARLMTRHYAAGQIRDARVRAGLGAHVTLAACRHGGLTELGDAWLTEQGVMALSGHSTPEAARLYVKRTDAQRAQAARQRRAWVDLEQAA